METVTYEVDPHGDLVVTLQSPNAPFAVWPAPDASDAATKGTAEVSARDQSPDVTLRLSSKHLILASKYFNRMLQGPWKEASNKNGKTLRLTAEGWNKEALLIVMNVIHGRNRKVPRNPTLEQLSMVAVIVDYYQCHEAFELWVDVWLESLLKTMAQPANIGREAILWLHVSWVFRQDSMFTGVTRMIQMEAIKPVPSLNLPVQEVLGKIEQVREMVVTKAISNLYKDMRTLASTEIICSKECMSLNLGATIRHIAAHGLFSHSKAPYLGISLSRLSRLEADFIQPTLYKGPPDLSKHEAVARLVSKKAFMNGYQAGETHGRVGPPRKRRQYADRNSFDNYFEWNKNKLTKIIASDEARVEPNCTHHVTFEKITKLVLKSGKGFTLKDVDSTE